MKGFARSKNNEHLLTENNSMRKVASEFNDIYPAGAVKIEK